MRTLSAQCTRSSAIEIDAAVKNLWVLDITTAAALAGGMRETCCKGVAPFHLSGLRAVVTGGNAAFIYRYARS